MSEEKPRARFERQWHKWLETALLAVSFLWPAWLLWGIRYATHDDLAVSQVAFNPEIRWFDFGEIIARDQGRVQAYISMPVWLFGNWIAEFYWSDLIFTLQIFIILLFYFFFLRKLCERRLSIAFCFVVSHAFAIHAFFMSPPGFHLMGLFSSSAFIFCLFFVYLTSIGKAFSFFFAMIFWFLSFFGPEYNIPVFTFILLVVIFLLFNTWNDRLRHSAFFLFAAIIFSFLYIHIRSLSIAEGALDERVTVSLSREWWSTFLTLISNSLLPLALYFGLRLDIAPVGGAPELPRKLDIFWLTNILLSDIYYLIAFILYLAAWIFLFSVHRVSNRIRFSFIIMSLSISLLPPAILSLSALYQRIVLAGYLQGHLATANIQFGALLLAVTLLAGWRAPLWLRIVPAFTLATLCTATLAYNLAMRDVLSANRQRWAAFALLAELQPERPVFAPDFWMVTGVSEPPQLNFPQAGSYWEDRARDVHGVRLRLRARDATAEQGDLLAGFAVSPVGEPALWVAREDSYRIVARRPGRWVADSVSGSVVLEPHDFICARLCEAVLPPGFTPATAQNWLRPGVKGVSNLPARLMLPRGGAFGAW